MLKQNDKQQRGKKRRRTFSRRGWILRFVKGTQDILIKYKALDFAIEHLHEDMRKLTDNSNILKRERKDKETDLVQE